MLFGTVVDINDPEKLGRVKVKVYGLHDNIESKELGWSKCLTSTNTPAQLGHGASVNLQVGTLVSCTTLDITQQEFIVTGTLPTKTAGEKDNNVRVRGEANPHANEPSGTYEPGSSYRPEYPYNNVYATESGHVKEYDDTPGAERIMERHKSGTQYEIQPDGKKIQRIVSDNYQLVCGHDTVEVHGNVRIIVSGNADIAVAKDLNAKVGGNMSADIAGNTDLLVKGDIDGELRGNIDLQVGPNKPEHIVYDANGVAVHNVILGGYTRWQAIDIWFPPVKSDTYTLTIRNMRTVEDIPSNKISAIDMTTGLETTANLVGSGSNLYTSEINGVQTEKFYEHSISTNSAGTLGDASITMSNQTYSETGVGQELLSFFLMNVSLHILGQVEYAFENEDYDGLEKLGYVYGAIDVTVDNWEGSIFSHDKVKLVDGKWTYPGKDSLTASLGNIDLHTEGGLNAIVGGEVDITAFQNAKLDIRKDANILIGGNSTSTITGNMTASIQGTTSLVGIDEDGDKLLSIDFDNAANKITLDSTDVEIKGNLKVVGTTHVKSDQLVDDHIHTQPDTGADATSQGNTGALS
jgi:hypothetical protein